MRPALPPRYACGAGAVLRGLRGEGCGGSGVERQRGRAGPGRGGLCSAAHAQRTGPWIAVLLQWPVVAAGSRGPGSPRLSVWKGWEQPWVPARIREARAGLKPCHGEAQAPQQCLHFSSCPSELSTASAQSSGACLLGSAGGQASLLCVHGPHGSTLQSELTVCTGGGVLEWDQLRGLQGLHFAFHSTGQASQMCSSSRMGTRAPAAAVNPSARTLVPLQPGPAAWQGDLLWLGSCGLQLQGWICLHSSCCCQSPSVSICAAVGFCSSLQQAWHELKEQQEQHGRSPGSRRVQPSTSSCGRSRC
ncbi:uncharacterized protein LOC135179842 isoform X1 [Pogoniulus pusillus]|uniref:uncharacterized protein LOC135179842 isoform X1 n=1 Tax=Pogoniulus pusillus TaxID=488313 RepID=UPI0030B99E87